MPADWAAGVLRIFPAGGGIVFVSSTPVVPSVLGHSVCNLLHVTLMTPIICRRHLLFLNVCTPDCRLSLRVTQLPFVICIKVSSRG
jgi:hypothetical protein